jgi:hypothetical protein
MPYSLTGFRYRAPLGRSFSTTARCFVANGLHMSEMVAFQRRLSSPVGRESKPAGTGTFIVVEGKVIVSKDDLTPYVWGQHLSCPPHLVYNGPERTDRWRFRLF